MFCIVFKVREDSGKRKATLDGSMGSLPLCQEGQDVGVTKHFEVETTEVETILMSSSPKAVRSFYANSSIFESIGFHNS